MDHKRGDLLRQIEALFDKQKQYVYSYYSEFHLRIPQHIKTKTIDEIRQAGGKLDLENIYIPNAANKLSKENAEQLRKKASLNDRLQHAYDRQKQHINKYYESIKRQIPPHIRNKCIIELDDEDWKMLCIDMTEFKTLQEQK